MSRPEPPDRRRVRGAVPADTRRHNRSLVLSTLLHHGPLSRADLSVRTGIAKPTVTDLTSVLVTEGIVAETGMRDAGRIGRPGVLLGLVPSHRHVISLDLSGDDRFDGAIVALDGSIVVRRSRSLEGAVGDAAMAALGSLVDDLRRAATHPLLGLAIGTPGRVLEAGRRVDASGLEWRERDLRAAAAASADGPLLIENDANLAAVAERRLGGGADDLLLVRIGRGVGAGVLLEGRLLEGHRSIAGEIGHVTVGDGTGPPCVCGRQGCLEAWMSLSSVPSSPSTTDASDRSGALAAAAKLGTVLAPVIAAIDVSEIVVSGPVGLVDDAFCRVVEMTVRARTLPGLHPDVAARVAAVPEAVLAGAAIRLVERELDIR